MPEDVYDKVFNLAKRRGFLYPAFEPYGGSAGFYDYGPLGARMKRRIEDAFRRIFVQEQGCVEIETPTVTVAPVFEASGHVARFADHVVKCDECGSSYRADHLLEEQGFEGNADDLGLDGIAAAMADVKPKCPKCGSQSFGEPYDQNLMFRTEVGPGSGQTGYLRPETAQGIFINFPNLYRFFREQLPFGVVQVGRAYRNEISPRQGILRLREFSQMECEYFFDPKEPTHPGFDSVRSRVMTFVPNTTGEPVERAIGDAVDDGMVCHALMGYWLVRVLDLLLEAGVDPERIRFRQHGANEMAHYANDCWDAEFESERFGWVECVGVADRSAYDLTQHAKHSGTPMQAVRKYDEPKRVTVVRFAPVHAKLGPLFRQKAKAVAAALEAVDEESVKAWDSGPVTVDVDGGEVDVPEEAFERVEREETRSGDPFVPNVIEPSFGVDRILYAALEHSYEEEEKENETFRFLRLPKSVVPVEVGVFPLFTKDGMQEKAREVEASLRKAGFRAMYDDSGSIGRRYARMDEIGAPFCVTIDHDTLDDEAVTIRDRDTAEQERVAIAELTARIEALRSA